MPTVVDTLTCIPKTYESGTTLRLTHADSEYPSSLWTAALVLNNGVAAATSIAGTASGTGFAFVIPASPAIPPGSYQWAIYYTAVSPTTEKARGATGSIEVIPNLATTATPSTAQAMVTALTAALAAFGKGYQSFSSGGVSYTKANISEYREDLVYWQAQLLAEKRKAAKLRGEQVNDGRITISFAQPGSIPCDSNCQ